ncbi:DUF4139 domain-containing protein [Deferribacter thermophilus]|uniref:DUF4139 domain-containing protein n=1 Tax=Deferribacter thermophilus TaxID=53573 RepID=UPI003C27D60D
MKKILGFFLLSFTLLVAAGWGSTVNIYKDVIYYKPDLKSNFIGFNNSVNVKCNGDIAKLIAKDELNEKCYLCYYYNKNQSLTLQLEKLNTAYETTNILLKNVTVNSNDFFDFNQRLTNELFNIKSEIKKVNKELKEIDNVFKRSAPNNSPFYLETSKCDDIELKFSGIKFDLYNTLTVDSISENKAKIRVVKKVGLINKSGVDILAKEAKLFLKRSENVEGNLKFSPWLVDVFQPIRAFMKAKSIEKSDLSLEDYQEGSVESEGNRVYSIKNLVLPSDGSKKEFILNSMVVFADYGLITYPYLSKSVYREITFDVPFDLENNLWQIRIGNEVFSNVKGFLEKDRYTLLAGKVYDIKVDRNRLIDFQEEAGFFGNKKRIKDGYLISLSNISNKSYLIKVVDRIPVSKNEKIKVEDVQINNDNCEIKKDGKLLCNIRLDSNQNVDIKVTFTILYDKDIEINY